MSPLHYPAYVFWKGDLTFVMVPEEFDWPYYFEISDVLWEDLFGWDSSGRYFKLEWDKRKVTPKPILGNVDIDGFRSTVEFYIESRKGENYPEPFFGTTVPEVSPSMMEQIVNRIEADAKP